MSFPLKILILEDSVDDAEMIRHFLLNDGGIYDFRIVMDREQFISSIESYAPDVILSDNSLPQFSAEEALQIVKDLSLNVPFILVTGTVSDEFAATIIKKGADDYILKDRLTRLGASIESALKQRQVEKERLHALKELRESNDRYQIVAKATSDTIRDWNIVTDKITWSRNLQTVFGYSDDPESTGKQWWFDKIHPDDAAEVQQKVVDQIRNKFLRFEEEYRFLCANGTYKYVNDRSFLVINDEGVPVRMIGAMQDVTRQKEEELRLKLLESVITNATDAVVITKAAFLDEGGQEIIYVNDAFTNMTGYTRDEVIGNSTGFLYGPKTNKEELKKLERCMKAGESCEIEIIYYNKQGEEFWVQKALSPVEDAKGNITNFIAIERDVTERKLSDQRITKAIISAQDQERYQLGIELHDNVTQILAGTLITLDLIRQNPEDPNVNMLAQKSHEYITLAIDEIRLLSHKMAPAIFLEESLKETFERLIHTMNPNNKFKVLLGMDAHETLNISSEIKLNLYRILQEQLNNITKYSGASEVDISILIIGKNVRMTIRDNGKGFDTTTVRKGIGLSNIQKRTELFLGSFAINSAIGKGCTLEIEIPFSDPVEIYSE